MMEFIEEDVLQKAEIKVINDINQSPNQTIEGFKIILHELQGYYNKIKAKRGKVLKLEICQRIREMVMMTDFTLDTINSYYHALQIDSETISEIKKLCMDIMELFKKIQERQNKNIDNKRFGGLDSVRWTEALDNPNEQYFKEDYERIIRLTDDWKVKNPNYIEDEERR